MKLKVFDKEKNQTEEIDLPSQFKEELRPDLIRRSVLSRQSKTRQKYGAKPEAGKRPSVRISKRRHDYRTCYGYGISRVPRKIFSRQGRRMNWEGAFAPGTRGGRKAHPPKAEKIFIKNINKKEGKKALRSAIAATINKDIVKERGHFIPDNFPFLLDKNFEDLNKTKDVKQALNKLGFSKELQRIKEKKIRAGKGKIRGRKYRTKKGPLIVVGENSKIEKAAKNIQGIDAINVKKLNIELLAPGAVPGRATLWTKNALEILNKEKLFT